jgi:hypothetical protein
MKLIKYLKYIVPVLLVVIAAVWHSQCSCAGYNKFWGRSVPEFCFNLIPSFEDGDYGIIRYIEGSFGALLMIVSGISGILCIAFKRFWYGYLFMAIAVAAFFIREMCPT